MADKIDQNEVVNRNRRARFVFITVAGCLITATIMGFRTDLVTKVNELVADGLISLAMFLSISYVAGSSLDYSGVLTRFAGRNTQPQDRWGDGYGPSRWSNGYAAPDDGFRGGMG